VSWRPPIKREFSIAEFGWIAEVLMANSKPNPVGVRKYLGLQVLRITAACMVLLTHSTFYASERLNRNFHVWGKGASGVDLFFVLSGFVMIFSSQKLLSDRNGWKIFAERRIVRIVPMYWIATSVKVLALLLTTGYVLHAQFMLVNVVGSYLFLPTFNSDGSVTPVMGVGWTLNFEMFFYFIFALALLLRWNVYRFVGGVLALAALGAFFRQATWAAVSFYLDTRVLEFFYGMIIAKLCLENRHLPKYPAMALLVFGFIGLLGPWPPFIQLHGLPYGIGIAAIVYAMASLEDVLPRIPRFVLFGADASYVIYLFHPFIAPAVPAMLMRLHIVHPWLSVACSVSLALAGGCAIHWFVEAPMTNWFRDHLLVGGKKIIHPVATV
jgi:exopolysaccharide production protein ExoZ